MSRELEIATDTMAPRSQARACNSLGLVLLILSQGCGHSTIPADDNSDGRLERLERLPKGQASETILLFDAATDLAGNLHVVWKNKDDAFFHTTRSESAGWTTPQPLSGAGRLLRLVATADTTHLFFSSGSEVFHVTGFSALSVARNSRQEKLVDTKWFIPSFSICSDGHDVFLACVSRSSEKKATLYQFSPGSNKILREEVFDLPSGSSLRDPEVATCFEAGRVHLMLRHGDSSLAYTSLDPHTLKPSAWIQVQTTFAPEVSQDFRQAGVGLILDGTLGGGNK